MTKKRLRARMQRAARDAEDSTAHIDLNCEIIWFKDIRPNLTAIYIIREVLDEGCLILVIGAPGSGKTFFVLDLALCVAAGLVWRGRKVRGGLVLYLAVEAGGSIARRVAAWRSYHGVTDANFAVRTLPLDFLSDPDLSRLLDVCAEIERKHGPIKLIVLDTVSRAMPGADENGAEDMTEFVARCDRLRQATKAAVILVHHKGKDPARGHRGHSSLKGAVDTEIDVAEHVATITKQRDGPSGVEIPFRLLQVEIGTDDEGTVQTSCVVLPREGDAPPPGQAHLTSRQKIALAALITAIELARANRSATDQALVTLDHRSAVTCVALEFRDLNENHRRRAEARRQIDALVSKGLVKKSETEIWLPEQTTQHHAIDAT